jgi:hypothetical protein
VVADLGRRNAFLPWCGAAGAIHFGAARASRRTINALTYSRSSAGDTPAGRTRPSGIVISDSSHARAAGVQPPSLVRATGNAASIEYPARSTSLLEEIAGRTVSDAVQELVVDKREGGLRSRTVKIAEFRLRALFQLDREVDGRNMPYAETGGLLENLRHERVNSCTGRW